MVYVLIVCDFFHHSSTRFSCREFPRGKLIGDWSKSNFLYRECLDFDLFKREDVTYRQLLKGIISKDLQAIDNLISGKEGMKRVGYCGYWLRL